MFTLNTVDVLCRVGVCEVKVSKGGLDEVGTTTSVVDVLVVDSEPVVAEEALRVVGEAVGVAGASDTELALDDGNVPEVGQLSYTVKAVSVVTVVVNHKVSVRVVVIGSGISGS